jgi:hypothetical protein
MGYPNYPVLPISRKAIKKNASTGKLGAIENI